MPPLNPFLRTGLALAIGQAILAPANAASISVNTGDDAGTIETCMLCQAIYSANDNATGTSNCVAGEVGTDVITFDSGVFPVANANTITLTSSLPTITTDLTITGQGTPSLTVDANNTGLVFRMTSSTVSLNSLTVTGGTANTGGGIHAYTNSSVTLNNSTVSGNSAAAAGGGIFARLSSSITLNNSTVSGNSAAGGGGIRANESSITLSNSTVSGNSANFGGGIFAASSSVNLSNSKVSGNSATYHGGGIYAVSSSVTLSNIGVSGNSSSKGGGIFAASSSVNLSNSTVSANSASSRGGGFYAYESSVTLSNSTVSGNSSGSYGGGISAKESSITLSNSTVSGNSADSRGGGIFARCASSVNLSNSIVAGNNGSSADEIRNDASTFTTSNNLLGDSSHNDAQAFDNFTPSSTDITATGGSAHSNTQATALLSILAPLANNGGETKTHALIIGSPAVDTGDNDVCAAAPINNLDQRGEVRPDGAACDIGAFEGSVEAEPSFFIVPLPSGKVITFNL